ncbi:hypothetical protein AX15_007597 [Amanita polypyramis BW_CC]|nr:hypothetical protein AX15_007597 [Amanita polypyramis BW_CC]
MFHDNSILDKLMEDNTRARKAKIYMVEGDGYRFCYFFRNADTHSVLIKRRYYTANATPTGGNVKSKGKRKSRPEDGDRVKEVRRPKRKRREKQTTEVESNASTEVTGAVSYDDEEIGPPCRDSTESPVTGHLDADDIMDLDVSEEEKPKPRMQLRYENLQLGGQCLCVVVEPLLERNNDKSGQPSTRMTSTESGIDRQPLFLPEQELDSEDESETVGDEGMMSFSQRLHAMGDYTTNLADDGEDVDGDVFLGDADDAREF